MLAQHPMTDTGSSDTYRGKKEQTVSVGILLMTGTVVSQHFGIPASGGNLVSSVQAGDNDSTYRPCLASSPALALALIAAALPLKLLWSRSPLLFPCSRRRLTLLPLPTFTRIPDALCFINLSLYGHSCPNHKVHIL